MHECNGLGRHEPDLDSLLQKASLQGPQNIWMLVINKNVLWYFSIRFFYLVIFQSIKMYLTHVSP